MNKGGPKERKPCFLLTFLGTVPVCYSWKRVAVPLQQPLLMGPSVPLPLLPLSYCSLGFILPSPLLRFVSPVIPSEHLGTCCCYWRWGALHTLANPEASPKSLLP